MKLRTTLALAMLFCLVAAAPADAIVRGANSTDPDGLRTFVVRIESDLGEMCTGVLIDDDLILTAAHCLLARARYSVFGLDRRFQTIRREAIAAALHPTFEAGVPPRRQPGADIAVLRIDAPFGRQFRSMPLVPLARPMEGEDVTIAGFGTTAFGRRNSARVLRYTYLRLRGEIRMGNTVLMGSDSERNSERAGAGACQGDSGGPILRGDPGTYGLIGLVSWSSGATGETGRTACGGSTAITPIAPHLDWIAARSRELRAINGVNTSMPRPGTGRGSEWQDWAQ
ncbi:MAG: peptidase S1 [Salinarimonadaceae bacterium]|nr:MAG: peptidase S1 [Salinarimonadaceae bacterium]